MEMGKRKARPTGVAGLSRNWRQEGEKNGPRDDSNKVLKSTAIDSRDILHEMKQTIPFPLTEKQQNRLSLWAKFERERERERFQGKTVRKPDQTFGRS